MARQYKYFFFNDTATTEIYTLSLHDALPIWWRHSFRASSDSDATLTHAVTYLWVTTEIYCGHLAPFPNWLLGSSAQTNLWAFVTAFKKSWYPLIWATFQKGLGYRSFASWLRCHKVSKGLIFEKQRIIGRFYQKLLGKTKELCTYLIDQARNL